MKLSLICILSLLFTISSFAQDKMMIINGDTIYILEPTKGDKLIEKGDVKGAIAAYRKEFKKNPVRTAYNFACAFARNNQPDSAFKYLNYEIQHDSGYAHLCLTDPDFISLRRDKRWDSLRVSVLLIVKIKHGGELKNIALAAKLWDMMAWDQAYYNEIFFAEKELGMNSPVVSALWELKERINIENQRTLDSIINVNGWPKISDVGHMGSTTAFLIVQHSTLELQEKYLPTIKSLCEQNEADWQSYALMYDRVQIGLGKPQLYGSQLTWNQATGKMEFYPIEDEANVNKRRTEMGLGTIEEYAKMMGVKYEPKNK